MFREQTEDKRRAISGHGVQRRTRRTGEGQKENTGLASAARGQKEDKTRTQSPDTELRGAASQCGQPFSSFERTPTVNCLGNLRELCIFCIYIHPPHFLV